MQKNDQKWKIEIEWIEQNASETITAGFIQGKLPIMLSLYSN